MNYILKVELLIQKLLLIDLLVLVLLDVLHVLAQQENKFFTFTILVPIHCRQFLFTIFVLQKR